MISKSTNPSLRKKMSGTFWKRKSSFLNFGGVEDSASTIGNGSVATSANDTLIGEQPQRSISPGPGEEIQGVKKRKSGTFWRRKSNQNLLDAYNGAQQNGEAGTNGSARTNGHTNGRVNGNADVVMSGTDEHTGYSHDYANGANGAVPKRSVSPPPQLPAFIGGGGGLGLPVDDMFKDFD